MKEKEMLDSMKATYKYLRTKDKEDYGEEEYEMLIDMSECARYIYTYLTCFLETVYLEKYLPKHEDFKF